MRDRDAAGRTRRIRGAGRASWRCPCGGRGGDHRFRRKRRVEGHRCATAEQSRSLRRFCGVTGWPARCHHQLRRYRIDLAFRCARRRGLGRHDRRKLAGHAYGIAAALPVFARQGGGHVINVVSTAGIKMLPTMGVYAATKNAVRTVTEILRQEAGPHLRVTEVSPGMTATNFVDSITDPTTKTKIEGQVGAITIPPDAIARGILYAIEQPPEVDVGSIVIRPTAQG
ncbi:SDR family oxidoreductase [Sphingomonas aerolata]|uniref:SDR family oxidoreductase n=1 Tax=Sphingomonas aerolata TaxID=185951 RepID=UPI003DA6F29B